MTFSLKQLFIRGRLPLTLTMLLAALAMVGLGFWQLQRLAQRRAKNAVVAARIHAPPLRISGAVGAAAALDYRPGVVVGTFDYANEVVLRNRTREQAPGVHVITPLHIANSQESVLVDRGWIPYEQQTPAARAAYQPAGAFEIQGILRASQKPLSSFGPVDPPLGPNRPRLDAWFRVDIERIQAQTPYHLLPVFVEQSPSPGAPALPWRENAIALDEGPHLSYAIQWFSFAVILLGGYIARAARVDAATATRLEQAQTL